MENLFLNNSYCKNIATYVEKITIINNFTALTFYENIFHIKSGGQPSDKGHIILRENKYEISELQKKGGEIFVVLKEELPFHDDLFYGEEADCYLDWDWRYRLMQYHTGAHTLMSRINKNVIGYAAKGMEIKDDASYCEVRFISKDNELENNIDGILSEVNELIKENKKVQSIYFTNIDEAKNKGLERIRIDPDLSLKGKIRIIDIEGTDFNPCGGTHVQSLGEIPFLNFLNIKNINGLNIIQFKL